MGWEEDTQKEINLLTEQRKLLTIRLAGLRAQLRLSRKIGAPTTSPPQTPVKSGTQVMEERLKQAFPGPPPAPQSGSPEWMATKTPEELAELRKQGLID